jgi:hypothetical protein
MFRNCVLALVLTATTAIAAAQADDAANVELLKAKIEALEAKLEAANLKIEKLQKENDELKAGGTPPSDSDPVEAAPNPMATLDEVEYELLQCVRDPDKRTRVAFTFGVMSERGMTLHYAPHQLSLTDSDGSTMDIKVVKGPPLKGDFTGIPRASLNLPKGQVIKFQIIVEGVKQGVTVIDRVELTAPDRGFKTDKVTFTKVKVASKK